MSVAAVIGRNTAYSLVARLSVMGAWFLLTPGLLVALGPERFGFWSILLALGGVLGSADLGLGVAVSRFAAEHVSRGRPRAIPRLIVRALALQLVIAGVIALALFLARERILDLVHVGNAWREEARGAFNVACVGFVIGLPFNLLTATLSGLQRMDLHALVAFPGALALFAAVAFAVRGPQALVGVTWAQVIVLGFLVAASGWAVRRALAHPGLAGAPAAGGETARVGAADDETSLGSLLRFSAWVQANSLLALVQQHVDKFLIAGLVALAPVAAYELGSRVASVAMLAPILALGALLPAFVRIDTQAPEGARVAAYRAALEPYLALVVPCTAGLVVLAAPLLAWWLGHADAGEVLALRAIALASGLAALTGVASTMVRAAGRPRLETEFGVATVVLHVVLSLLGSWAWGWPGVLAGLVASSALAAPLFIARVERWLGLRPLGPSARSLVGPLGAALAAVLAAAAVVAWRGPVGSDRTTSAITLTLGGLAFSVVYVLGLSRLAPGAVGRLWSVVSLARARAS